MPFPSKHHPGWAAVSCACLCLAPAAAFAQILDRIEVSRSNGVAEIRIDFAVQVQYQRHTPPGKGRELNIFIKPINAPPPESEAIEETLSAPETDIVPTFKVLYPHLGNAVAIRFAQETEWTVRPAPDGRSIVVVVPVLRGARDVVAEVRALPPQPKPKAEPIPAPIPAPVAVPPTPPIPTVTTAAAPSAVTPTPPAAPPAPAPQPAPQAPPAAQLPATPPPEPPSAPQPAASTAAAPEAGAETGGQVVPLLTPEQVESIAKGFMGDARKALEDKDLARAINRLNRTLGMPTNAQTETAQALIGEVREINGEINKARAEYDLYLKLYPQGKDAARIKERLAALPKDAPRVQQARSRPLQRGPAEWMVYGSFSQYYYTGKSHIEVTTPPPPGLLDFTTDVLSLTDQDALISNLDINARRRDGITDTRIVFRDSDTQNFLNKSRSYNRLYSAYVEQSDRQAGYFVRAGRQTPTGGGVFERFDGLNVGYSFADRWRVNGVAGYAVEFLSPFKKDFIGASLEMQPQPDQIGLTGYVVQQHLDGILNRQAIGMEARYFDMHATAFGMLDYDILYKGINIAMLQGNYRTDDGLNLTTYVDYRKVPAYSLTNAYALLNGMTVKQAISAVGIEQMRADARALTATSNLFSVGLTYPLSPKWQLGADYRAASISGTREAWTYPTAENPDPILVAAYPAQGTNHVVGLQAIGYNLMATNDLGVVNTNFIKGADYNGQALSGSYVYSYGDAWRLELNLRYYQQKNDATETQKRTSPSLKLGYRWGFASIEGEAGQEDVKVDGPERVERSNRKYVFVGYRLELR
jgi:hypothetical protein